MTNFIKETDNKGKTYIIGGEKKQDNVFSVNRFICEIQKQETEEETQQVADLVLFSLSKTEQLNQLVDHLENCLTHPIAFIGNVDYQKGYRQSISDLIDMTKKFGLRKDSRY